jgi:hypothetical protein
MHLPVGFGAHLAPAGDFDSRQPLEDSVSTWVLRQSSQRAKKKRQSEDCHDRQMVSGSACGGAVQTASDPRETSQ